jgi:hypothetical protein
MKKFQPLEIRKSGNSKIHWPTPSSFLRSRRSIFALFFLISMLGFSGCTLIRTPFADVQKLGTVLKSGGSITIRNADRAVTVEYIAPTKRRIIWNGESREILLFKSSLLNGIYSDSAKLHPGSIGKLRYAGYTEATLVFKSQMDADVMIGGLIGYGYEHRPEEHMLVRLETQRYYSLGLKFLEAEHMDIIIYKYEIKTEEKKGVSQ